MKIFGIDPGSERTGYGCVESTGSRHRLVICGSLAAPAGTAFPDKLRSIHAGLVALLERHKPDCVAIENIFHARNVRSALKLGHARGIALLAASEAGLDVVEYAPAEIKRAVVGYGRAEKPQVQQMVKLLLGLDAVPTPHDAADALAVAICHLHASATTLPTRAAAGRPKPVARSWRDYRPRPWPERGAGAPAEARARLRQGYGGQPPLGTSAKVGGKPAEGRPPSESERGWGPASRKK